MSIMQIRATNLETGEVLNFIVFNYDGEGSSMAIISDGVQGAKAVSVYSKKDTKDIIEGGNGVSPRYNIECIEP